LATWGPPGNQIQQEKTHQTEHEDVRCVPLPVHFSIGIDSPDLVDKLLNRPECAIQTRDTLALEHPGHVGAKRLDEKSNHAEEENDLQPALSGHPSFSGFTRA
jgi:hypothetical protein